MNWQAPLGIVATCAGGLLAMVPRAAGREADPTVTWWPLGVPIALLGLALLVWDWSLRRPTR